MNLDLSNLKLKDSEVLETPKKDFEELERSLFVDISEELKPQPIALSVGYHDYKGASYTTPFGSYGDFSCIVGASKSKKTFLKSLLMACYIGGNSTAFAPEIKGHNTKDKFILDFDTEQSKFHTQRVARRVSEIVGDPYEYFKPYGLRELSEKERFEFIEYMILESEYRNNIGLIGIDGVADLITDINSVEQATKLTTALLKWTALSKAHLITVLHRNFGTQKPTGHVGSFVLKKAETVAFVDNEDNNVIVKPEYTRNIAFNQFSFSVGNDWLPRVVNSINSNNYL